MLYALIALGAVCIMQTIFLIWYLRYTQNRIDDLRSDLMDRFMESDLIRLRRAKAIMVKAEKGPADNGEREQAYDLDEETMRARL